MAMVQYKYGCITVQVWLWYSTSMAALLYRYGYGTVQVWPHYSMAKGARSPWLQQGYLGQKRSQHYLSICIFPMKCKCESCRVFPLLFDPLLKKGLHFNKISPCATRLV
ncbi:hypothetical protein XELAEV_18002530mg [Xenopus laevis]|nr:hypothetical protein XELAEV_18002530mg [Xenopus laevis]